MQLTRGFTSSLLLLLLLLLLLKIVLRTVTSSAQGITTKRHQPAKTLIDSQ